MPQEHIIIEMPQEHMIVEMPQEHIINEMPHDEIKSTRITIHEFERIIVIVGNT